MNQSAVQVSLRDENGLDCSYAIVQKSEYRVIILVRAADCAIYDANELQMNADAHYLLLKHYPSESIAYRDFMKLIGKMCTKSTSSKYFAVHVVEDNRMVVEDAENEHMITTTELMEYAPRFSAFKTFVNENRAHFFKAE